MNQTDLNWTGSSDEPQANVGQSPNGNVMEDDIRRFLADLFFLGDDPAAIPDSKSLIEAGILDSTGILELIGFLEEEFGIAIEDDELIPENLDSIANIVQFVTRKRSS